MLENAVEGTGSQFVARFAGHRYQTWLRLVLELAMAASGSGQVPPVLFNHLDNIAHLHDEKIRKVYRSRGITVKLSRSRLAAQRFLKAT